MQREVCETLTLSPNQSPRPSGLEGEVATPALQARGAQAALPPLAMHRRKGT